MHKKTALVLEGGSVRCMFTAGVLDVFLERDMAFPCVAGVSAGALSGLNYVAGQQGRFARVSMRFMGDKRYQGVGNLLKHRSLFNFDFMFGEVSEVLEPLDMDAFHTSKQRFVAFSTDVVTGRRVVHEKGRSEDILLGTRASSSMPLLTPIVEVDGHRCLDGAVSGAVPIDWAMDEGYEKIVVVLTRQQGYQKKATSGAMAAAFDRVYRCYPVLAQRCKAIPEQYNRLQTQIDAWERERRIFVIRPDRPVGISRVEKDPQKLEALYLQGRDTAQAQMAALLAYLDSNTPQVLTNEEKCV